MRGSDAPPIEAQRRPRGDEPQSQRQQDLAEKWAFDKILRSCSCLLSISVSIFAVCLDLRRIGGSDNVLGLGLGLPSLALPGLAERIGATAEAQVEKVPRTRRWCAGLAGARAANSICKPGRGGRGESGERALGAWALSRRARRADASESRRKAGSRFGRFSPAPSWMDEWMARRWESGWASTKVGRYLGRYSTVSGRAREDQAGGSEGLGAEVQKNALKH
ncbi:hypothetical protein V8C44DRAFT_53729 [Trichoderma aethiopicum]